MNIRKILHNKRAATEDHIRQLDQQGQAGIRYTATMPDIPFLLLGLLCDVGWLIHLCAGIAYFRENKTRDPLDGILLLALAAVMAGIVYTIRLNKIHEKEIATGLQKNMSFGLTIFGGLAGGLTGILQLILYQKPLPAIIWMVIGGLLNFITGLPIFLSFKKGIIYGIQ